MSKHGYGSLEYWEEAYAKSGDAVDDWLQRWDVLAPLLIREVPRDGAVLILGCGNSPLGEQMWDAGYRAITSIDFSPTVIAAMKRRSGERALVYQEMDARALRYADGSFGAVIDKGTIDAVICHPDRERAVAEVCDEAFRVLAPGGVFLSISLRPPDLRRAALEGGRGWRAEVHTVPKMRVIASDDPEANLNWVYVLRR